MFSINKELKLLVKNVLRNKVPKPKAEVYFLFASANHEQNVTPCHVSSRLTTQLVCLDLTHIYCHLVVTRVAHL